MVQIVQWLSEGGRLDCWIFVAPTILPFLNIFTARVDFGIAFSIKFLSSSALLGFSKALEQDAMSSSASRRKL